MGDLFPVVRETEKGLSRLLLAHSQVALIQRNLYAIVVHLGVACPGPLQCGNAKDLGWPK